MTDESKKAIKPSHRRNSRSAYYFGFLAHPYWAGGGVIIGALISLYSILFSGGDVDHVCKDRQVAIDSICFDVIFESNRFIRIKN